MLDLVAKSESPMTLLEIEKALDIPKSSTFELVYTLVDRGFIEQVDKKFSLGVHAFQVGILYERKLDVIQLSKEILDNLAKETKETIFLAKYINDKMVYIDKHSQHTDLSSTCSVGESKELYCTALGKSVLSKKSDLEIEAYFDRKTRSKHTEFTIDNAEDMKTAVIKIRQQGYATENKEGSTNIYCVGAPILNHMDVVIAAVSVAIPISRIDEEKIKNFGALVSQAALEVSHKLGFSGDSLY